MHPSANDITYLASTNHRPAGRAFGIKQADRLSHLYVIGKTGTGKSTLLETMMRQDLAQGRGFALLDPHGDLVERIAAGVPEGRRSDLVYLDAANPAQPYGYNPLRRVRADKIPLAASGLLEVFKARWSDAWGPKMEHLLRNAIYALLEKEGSTLPEILQLLSDDRFRRTVARSLRNEPVRRFWLETYEKYPKRFRAEAAAPVENKVGAFLADPALLRVLTGAEEEIRIRRLMDRDGVLLVNLAKGRIGEDSSSLLGSLLVTTIALAAFSRAGMPGNLRRPFFVYLDEFQNFATESVASMVSELRKYGVGLVLSHQHLEQLTPKIREAVLGNVGTTIAFRVGPEDARYLAREFEPVFDAMDLANLPNYHVYLRLLVDGEPTQPFSAVTSSKSGSQSGSFPNKPTT